MTREEIKALLEHAEKYWPMSEKALEYFCMLQLHDLGWECVDAEHDSEQSSSFGRKDFEQVVLTKYLKPRLESLNRDSPKTAIEKAIDFFLENRSVMQTVNANKEIYLALKEGVKVTCRDQRR